MSSQDLTLILHSYLLGLVLQLITWPVVFRVFQKNLVDKGWMVGRILGWLVISLVAWWLGFMGVPIKLTIWLMAGVVLVVGGYMAIRERMSLRTGLREVWVFVLTEELLFLLGFLGLSFIRSFNPDILDLEKFMDAGLVTTYLRSVSLPAEDMWLAGEKINYYTFGHFMGAVQTIIWGIDLAYSYNLLLGLLAGLTLSLSFSVVVNLAEVGGRTIKKEKMILGGIVGSLLVAIGGNSQTSWFFLKNKTFEGYWYADATRFIENTIHEFPSYSFVVSDLHAHLWDLPIVLLFLLVLLIWQKEMQEEKKERWSAVIGGLLGVMTMTNTWDLLIYGLLTMILGGLLLFRGVSLVKLFRAGILAGVALLAVSSLWWMNFVNIGEGWRVVTKRSPLWQLVVLWMGHIALSVVAWCFNIRRQSKKGYELKSLIIAAMILTAFMLLLIPELVYMKDIYPNHPRANTMFKLTYQAFVLMSLVAGWLVVEIQAVKFRWWKIPLVAVIVAVTASLLVFPYFGYRGFYGEFKKLKGLDGLSWLQMEYPDDYTAILWLKENERGRPVIVEAIGESYTTFGRVSVFTGMPTILGWRVHEWLWRGGFEIPAQRTEEVKTIYEKPETKEAKILLSKYRVKYIFVGNKEREAYQEIDEAGLRKFGEIVFERGKTLIIRRFE